MSECKKVKTAIVGCGMISDIYIRNLSKLFSIIDLVALCNRTQATAEKKAQMYNIPRIMTLDEIAADEDIDLVVNLTGPVSHYSVIRQMLDAGKHVYTEKVLTTDIEKSRELVKLAEKKGLYLGVAPDTVLGAGLQTARKVLDCGLIGNVASCLVSINRNQVLNSEVFTYLQNEGGDLPFDVGVYYVAALLTLLGPVKAIRAFGAPALLHEPEFMFANAGKDPWRIPGNNVISASLLFENGTLGSVLLDGNTVNCEQSNIILFGTEGILKVGDPNRFDTSVTLIRPESGECIMPFTHGYDGRNYLGEASPVDGYGNRGIGVAEMAWAIRNGRKDYRCSKEYGLHCQEVLYGMNQAASSGMTYETRSRFVMKPLKSGYYSSMFNGQMRADAERSLVD